MSSDLAVSVIVPVYNGARFLPAAIESIRGQTRSVQEIIVVDDGSTDETPELVGRLGHDITLVRQENRGPAAARNRGLATAGGDVLAFLDVDDRWRPRKLELQLHQLRADDVRDGAWGMTRVMMLAGTEQAPHRFEPWGEPRHYPQVGSILFRRRVFDRLTGFDEQHTHADDIDLIARAEEAGLILHRHADVVLEWRRHEENITNDVARARTDFMHVVKRALDRKRPAKP